MAAITLIRLMIQDNNLQIALKGHSRGTQAKDAPWQVSWRVAGRDAPSPHVAAAASSPGPYLSTGAAILGPHSASANSGCKELPGRKGSDVLLL